MTRLKKLLYFPLAGYFRFFAQIQLNFWKPKIIVITGSSGKTTLLHVIQSQLGENARYSHHANSSYGIPFDILGLSRKTLLKVEWFYLFLATPFKAFKRPFKENLYIVEADCDRPGEGRFLASLLKPEVTLWVSVGRTHSMNFDVLVEKNIFSSVDEAIAYEFGYFLEYCKNLVVINGDSDLIGKQLNRTNTKVETVSISHLKSYKVKTNSTVFETGSEKYEVKALITKEGFYAIEMTRILLLYLGGKFDKSFANFVLPPGRSSKFEGVKNTFLIDSSYNANFASMESVVNMFNLYPAKIKWVVLADMLEQGNQEKEEHEKLASLLNTFSFSKIILMGPRVLKYTYPLLKQAVIFETPEEVLNYLRENIRGGEVILFKGARFLEGVIEHLLKNKEDKKLLVRREKVWQERRRNWGL